MTVNKHPALVYGLKIIMKVTHYPFVFIAGFFGLGIALSRVVSEFFGVLSLMIIISLIFSIKYSHLKLASTIVLLVAITVSGMIYAQSRQRISKDDITHVAKYYRNKPILIKGMITSSVVERSTVNGVKTTFTLGVDQVQAKWGWQKRNGIIKVNIFRALKVDYGDYIQLEGKLHRPYNFSPDDNFSYRDYLANRGIYYLLSAKKSSDVHVLEKNKGKFLRSAALKIRNRLKNILSANLSASESGIMKAILLGDRSTIMKPVRELFVQTGTVHILAISGLHIGIAAALFLMFMKCIPLGRKWQLGCGIILLISYAFLTGGRPSVIRATIMMTVFLLSFIIERESQVLNTLFLAAIIILVINPSNLFDVGFQLSFVCILSIIFLNLGLKGKKFVQLFGQRRQAGERFYNRLSLIARRSLALSLAIWIGVAGFIAYYFGIITPITIFANLLVIPLVSIIVPLGFGLLIVGVILPSWAILFATCLKVMLNTMVGLIFLADKIPFAHVYISGVQIWHVVIYYSFLSVVICICLQWHHFSSLILRIIHLGGRIRQACHRPEFKVLSKFRQFVKTRRRN